MVNMGKSAKSCIKWLVFKKWATKAHSANTNSSASWNSSWVSESFKLHFWLSTKVELQTHYVGTFELSTLKKSKENNVGSWKTPKKIQGWSRRLIITLAHCKQIADILITLMPGICTCWISKLFCPKTSLVINLSVAESSQKPFSWVFFFFEQTEWRPFFSSSCFNYNSLSQRLMQINFKICYK